MIEMLGVLAIIGVLSVGAIAGYQKAMFKYKLNKHAESFNILINNIIQYRSNLSGSGFENADPYNGGIEYYAEFFKKLNLIPDSMKYYNKLYLQDIFGQNIWIYHYKSEDWIGMGINIEVSHRGQEICANIVKVTKESRANLKRVVLQQVSDGTVTSGIGALYGDSYCDADKKCLAKLTLSDIDAICNVCVDVDSCALYVSIPV